ncbi:MAG TPA: FAD:protein FMN transferase, partial [Anaerolineaceae bacterium]
MRFHEFRAMNTNILLAAEGEPQRVAEGFRAIEEQIHAQEARFTRFADTSELSALNHSAGGWFHASSEMFEVLRQAQRYYQTTNGLFNPGILQALENAGYDRSMDEIRAAGGVASLLNKRPVRSDLFAQMRMDDRGNSIFLPAGLRIDLGGIAKGWIAERAARNLSRFARVCLVDAGGDMFACGIP